MKKIKICIPSRNRSPKLSNLLRNLHESGILDLHKIYVFESASKTTIPEHPNLNYKHDFDDVLFSTKLKYFLDKLRGEYVLLLSDDDEYDFVKLRSILLIAENCLNKNDCLFLFQIFGPQVDDFRTCIQKGRLPFYLISSFIFKVECHPKLEKIQTIWYQNFLLHDYFGKDFFYVLLKPAVVKYIEGDGFAAWSGLEDFRKTINLISVTYSLPIDKALVWEEYRHTQRRLAKKLIRRPLQLISIEDIKYFKNIKKPLTFKDTASALILQAYGMGFKIYNVINYLMMRLKCR